MESDLTELESPEDEEFPLFHINEEHFSLVHYETEKADFDIVEKYIYACFSCLPFSRLKTLTTNRYIVESYCETAVFYNKENILCSILEKICKDRSVFFFEILNQRINNEEFVDCEESLKYFMHIWNNFLTVILHLSDVFKVFMYYNKADDHAFKTPAEIFCNVWRDCFQKYAKVKDFLFNSVYDYMKRDQLYSEKNFFKCVYNNIKDNDKTDLLFISVEGLDTKCNVCDVDVDKYDDISNRSSEVSLVGGFRSKSENKESILQKRGVGCRRKGSFNGSSTALTGGSEIMERNNGKRVRLNTYGQEHGASNTGETRFFHLLSKEIKDDLKKYKLIEKSAMLTDEVRASLLGDTFKTDAQKTTNANNNSKTEDAKINDRLLAKCMKILDNCNLYESYANMYVKKTLKYYDNKMENRLKERIPGVIEQEQDEKNNKNVENYAVIKNLFNIPVEIETFLCNEQIRCRKFLKRETEKTLLRKLKEVLILKNVHFLFNEETIKQCILCEHLESLRTLYLFAVNMCNISLFCNLFFRCVKALGVVVIQRIMKDRDNVELINEAMTDLANFKLNIDRIVIISFKHSSRFIKKWKETFEHLLCSEVHTDRYMSYIVSLYLNNLLMMHNACMKKMKKINMVYKEFLNHTHQAYGAPTVDALEDGASRSVGFFNADDDGKTDVSVDSDGIYVIKKHFENFKEIKKKQNGSEHMTMQEVQLFSRKIKKVFVKYTDIGKNILNKITIMLSVFKFLDNKERFEKHFRIALSKRLLNDEYLNIFLDVNVFKALKKECGSPYTKKIEYIIKDIQEEKQLMNQFYTSLEQKQNVPYFIKKKKFTVKAVCEDAWDFLKLKEKVIYPEFIRICNEQFVEFYKEHKKGRSAVMQPLLGLCVLKVNLEMMSNINNATVVNNRTNNLYTSSINNALYDDTFSRLNEDLSEKMGEAEWSEPLLEMSPNASADKKMCYNINLNEMKSFCFIVTVVQGIVLLLFNQKYEYTTEEIENLTGLKKPTVQHFLKPLYAVDQTKILLYDEANDKMKLNYLFKPYKKYIKVGYTDLICSEDTVIPPTAETEDTIADKNLFIDAAIVHYLKINTTAPEKDICDNIISRKPGTTAEEVKARIDSLLQKEFIGMKDDLYCYI